MFSCNICLSRALTNNMGMRLRLVSNQPEIVFLFHLSYLNEFISLLNALRGIGLHQFCSVRIMTHRAWARM